MKQIGVNFGSICVFSCTSCRRINLFIAEINPVKELVEYGNDKRFMDIDIEFLKQKRVEIDVVLAAVGSKRLGIYNENAIRIFNSYIDRYVRSLVTEEERKIESELENVEGFINVEDKRD